MTSASVVVPSHAGEKRLPRLLSALAAQSHSELEIIVVLDGVVDDSERVLDAASIDLRRVVLPRNQGRAAALNAGFAVASGDVLIRCDDDLEPAAGWARAHVAAHACGPVGVVGLCPNVYPDTAYARAYGRKADIRFRRAAYAASPDRTWIYWGGNVSVTRQTFDRIGGYGADYRAYGWEDVDWGYRLHEAGIPVRIHEDAEAAHHGASTSTAVRSNRAYQSGAAQRTFERLHGVAAHGPRARPRGVWGAAVRSVARLETVERVARVSGLVDAILPVAPRAIGEKLVALSVESAALAGYDRAAVAG